MNEYDDLRAAPEIAAAVEAGRAGATDPAEVAARDASTWTALGREMNAAARAADEDAIAAIRTHYPGMSQPDYGKVLAALRDPELAERTWLIEMPLPSGGDDPLTSIHSHGAPARVEVSDEAPTGKYPRVGTVEDLREAALDRMRRIARQEHFVDHLDAATDAVGRGEASGDELRELATDTEDFLDELNGRGIALSVDETGERRRQQVSIPDTDRREIRKALKRGDLGELRALDLVFVRTRGVEDDPDTLAITLVRHPDPLPEGHVHKVSLRQLAVHVAKSRLIKDQFGSDADVILAPSHRAFLGRAA